MKHWILLFVVFSTSLFGKATVCLNMIVKDESHVIKRCLDSVKPLIDYWVIVDTGSIDGTQEIIRRHMSSIPGELHERPWKNFGHNRNEALDLATKKCDYILFIDADDWFKYESDFTLHSLTQDAYHICLGSDDFSYTRPLLVKDGLPWKWVGILHEYLDCDAPHQSEVLQGIFCVNGWDGASYQDPEKYLKHAQFFEEALLEEPDNARYMFYLGQSYSSADKPEKALEAYLKRAQMRGWEEEVFWSLFKVAMLRKEIGASSEEIIESFARAHRFRPHRPEPVYYLAQYYNEIGEHSLAYELITGFSSLPPPPYQDNLFNYDWIKEWGLLFEFSICSYYIGKDNESLDACNILIKKKQLPERHREQVIKNRRFPEERLACQ